MAEMWLEVWRCSLGVGLPSFGLMGTTSKYCRTPPHEQNFWRNGVPPQKEEEKKKSFLIKRGHHLSSYPCVFAMVMSLFTGGNREAKAGIVKRMQTLNCFPFEREIHRQFLFFTLVSAAHGGC